MVEALRSTIAENEMATESVGAAMLKGLRIGDIVLLDGPLGAGKTTFVRGLLRGAGHSEPVRSPTYNLLQEFDTKPPVLHVDLYRVESAARLGLEEYFDSHLCLIEWPDRLGSIVEEAKCWRVHIQFEGDGRRIEIEPPSA